MDGRGLGPIFYSVVVPWQGGGGVDGRRRGSADKELLLSL